MAEREDGGALYYLEVSMGGRRCAIPARRVLKVLRRVKLYSFPSGEPAFLGLARFGTEPVAVLDGAVLFDLEDGRGEAGPDPVVVMVSGGRREQPEVFGLLVDEAGRTFAAGGASVNGLDDLTICDPGRLRPDGGE